MRFVPIVLMSLVVVPTTSITAQGSAGSTSEFDLTVQAGWSQKSESGSQEGAPVISLGVAYRLPSRLAFELRSSYRSWERETYVPLHLGVRYDLRINEVVTVSPFAGVGPSAMLGNDWAGFFASYEAGGRVYLSLGEDARVRATLEASYGRAMAFHPSEFGLWNLAGGLNIGL